LREWAEEILLSSSHSSCYLDLVGVRQVWNWFQNGRTHLADVLGVLLGFALWTRHSASHLPSSLPRPEQGLVSRIPAQFKCSA